MSQRMTREELYKDGMQTLNDPTAGITTAMTPDQYRALSGSGERHTTAPSRTKSYKASAFTGGGEDQDDIDWENRKKAAAKEQAAFDERHSINNSTIAEKVTELEKSKKIVHLEDGNVYYYGRPTTYTAIYESIAEEMRIVARERDKKTYGKNRDNHDGEYHAHDGHTEKSRDKSASAGYDEGKGKVTINHKGLGYALELAGVQNPYGVAEQVLAAQGKEATKLSKDYSLSHAELSNLVPDVKFKAGAAISAGRSGHV